MTTYLVVRRIQEDRSYLPGETVRDPEFDAEILMQRGYLVIVPDDYRGTSSREPRPPTVDEALAAGYTPEAAERMSKGEYGPAEDAETAAIDAALSAPTENELKAMAAEMTDDNLDGAIEAYEIEVEEGVSRTDKETALVAWLLKHPEITNEEETPEPVPAELAPESEPIKPIATKASKSS